MKNLQRGFIVPLVIGVIVLLAIGGGVYYSKSKQEVKQIDTTAVTSSESTTKKDSAEIATWKTYTNLKYGYEISYPSAWKPTNIFSKLGGFEGATVFVKASREDSLSKSLIDGSDIGSLVVQDSAIIIQPAQTDVLYKNKDKNRSIIQASTKTIAGKNVEFIFYSAVTDPNKFGGGSAERYVFSGKTPIMLQVNYSGVSPSGEIKSVADQMLPTFKFTGEYFSVKELGIKFRIPDDIKDLIYVMSADKKSALFTTESLKSKGGSYCGPDDSPLGLISIDTQSLINRGVTAQTFTESDTMHNVNGTWVYYNHPQSTCSADKNIQALAVNQIKSLMNAFKIVESETR